MKRKVVAEWLDDLPDDDPRALRSRNDLYRVNGWMRNDVWMAAGLRQCIHPKDGIRLIDLGSGDGRFALRSVSRLSRARDKVLPFRHVVLVDRTLMVATSTMGEFALLGWQVSSIREEVIAWLSRTRIRGVFMTNLFLHHFADDLLESLLAGVARCADGFVAIEPRRCSVARLGSRLLVLAGSNEVTRHDAKVSVEAGFTGRELSKLWPDHKHWSLQEHRAGWFSHRFIARKMT